MYSIFFEKVVNFFKSFLRITKSSNDDIPEYLRDIFKLDESEKTIKEPDLSGYIMGLIFSILFYIGIWYILFCVILIPVGGFIIGPTLSSKVELAYNNAQRGSIGYSSSYVYQKIDIKGYNRFEDTIIVISKKINPKKKKAIINAIISSSKKYDVSPKLIFAIIKVESNFNEKAKSNQNARGLMQLLPSTAKDLKVMNIHSIEQNVDGGTKYIKQLLSRFKSIDLALAAYNAGPANVEKYGAIPPFRETLNYVRKVKAEYSKL